MRLSQAKRAIAVGSPLGEDVLVLRRMVATEELGRLFEFQLDLLSEDSTIKLEDVLGEPMTVRMELQGKDETRYFNGFVSRFSHVGLEGRLAVYKATLSPWLWFLTRTADCRIFQNQTVPDIVKSIFREHGFTDFQELLSGQYRSWEYCVQYRETDFNFVSRLLEQEGIYYYFKHENGKHILVLCDSYSSHDKIPPYEKVPFLQTDVGSTLAKLAFPDHIFEWSLEGQVKPGAFALNDFDFKAPRKNLQSLLREPEDHARADYEVYDYPGEYTQSAEGDAYARVRMEELLAQQQRVDGQGNVQGLFAGALFSLIDHPREDQNREYLMVSAVHELQSDAFQTNDASTGGTYYQCNFTAIDANRPYRSLRITPKPVVKGPQTAIVVGKQGEEIWTDQWGRVKVHFHWDRYGKANENDSCWIRVAQVWAGKQWGSVHIPRIGQEVIVDFLEGDPDRPLIVGNVYNDVTKPPYELPAKATLSGIKTSSSKGSGGFNEIRFEDKKGEEQLFVHAEKNQDIRIKNDAMEWIGHQRHLIVKDDQLELVEGDKHSTVKGDHREKLDGTLSLDVGMDRQEKVGMKHALDAGMEIHLKGGMNVVIEAGMSITLKAGGGFVVVGPAGVTISGTPVLINSGGSPGSGSGASPETPEEPKVAATAKPGAMSEVQASPIQVSGIPPEVVTVQAMQADTLRRAAEAGTPFCEKCEAAKAAAAAAQES